MMWYGWGPGGWVAGLLMMLMMLVFWGGLIALVVWAIRRSGRPSEPRNGWPASRVMPGDSMRPP